MNRYAARFFSGMALAAFSLVAMAQETPSTLAGGKVVGASEAKSLAESKGVTVLDTRAVLNFGKGHLPGAVAAAYKEKSEKNASFDPKDDAFDMAKLPADKAAKVLIYSDGPTGWKSYKAAVMAVKAGYTNVMYFRGGVSEWQAAGYPLAK